MIYKHYIALLVPPRIRAGPPHSQTDDAFTCLPGPLPSLYYTNRLIHSELTPLLLRSEIFIADVRAAQSLLRYLRDPFHAPLVAGIHALAFSPFVSWCPAVTHTNRALLAACTSLRRVEIEVPASTCVDSWVEPRADLSGEDMEHVRACQDLGCERCKACVVERATLCSRKTIVERMDLCCLMDCETLEELELVCRGESMARRLGSTRELVYMPLLTWVRKNICSGGKVRLRVDYGGKRVLGGKTLY